MNDTTDSSEAGQGAHKPPVCPQDRPKIDVEQLLAGKREVCLCYRDEEYRLRITRNSKLILTK
ncbi:MAG TPA: hemin uptake protein HemP [Phycisphaerae bacterium]|nr:hemin uptake protein HemP [Phycisphaerae bacterium]